MKTSHILAVVMISASVATAAYARGDGAAAWAVAKAA